MPMTAGCAPRYAVFAAVLGLAANLLVDQPFGVAKPAPHWTLSGHTSQNGTIRLRLDARHRVRTFDAPTRLRRRPRFDAEEFRRIEHADGMVSTSEGTIRGVIDGDKAHGSVDAFTSYRWPDGRRQVCTSGRVRWTAVA